MGLRVAAFRRPWANDVALFVSSYDAGKRSIGRFIQFEDAPEGSYEPEPTFALHMEEAQQLMDELWNAGLRPTLGRQSEGAFDAQGRHLEDMRALVFKIPASKI